VIHEACTLSDDKPAEIIEVGCARSSRSFKGR
jgi:hypothetical protein